VQFILVYFGVVAFGQEVLWILLLDCVHDFGLVVGLWNYLGLQLCQNQFADFLFAVFCHFRLCSIFLLVFQTLSLFSFIHSFKNDAHLFFSANIHILHFNIDICQILFELLFECILASFNWIYWFTFIFIFIIWICKRIGGFLTDKIVESAHVLECRPQIVNPKFTDILLVLFNIRINFLGLNLFVGFIRIINMFITRLGILRGLQHAPGCVDWVISLLGLEFAARLVVPVALEQRTGWHIVLTAVGIGIGLRLGGGVCLFHHVGRERHSRSVFFIVYSLSGVAFL